MNQTKNRRQAIQLWMMDNIRTRGFERGDDLHLDMIDPEWKVPTAWVAAGLEAFRMALKIRESVAPDFIVTLAYPLEGDEPRGVDFSTLDDLAAQFTRTPPSLYLSERGKEPWENVATNGVRGAKELLDCRALGVQEAKRCYFLETKLRDFPEWCRTVYIDG